MSQLDLSVLLETIKDQRKKIEAQSLRIKHLEFLLEQRSAETLKKYDAEAFEGVKGHLRKIFLDNPSIGLSYADVRREFEERQKTGLIPKAISTTDLPQRIRDLYKEGFVWKHPDEKEVQRFYLKLEKTEEEKLSLNQIVKDVNHHVALGEG